MLALKMRENYVRRNKRYTGKRMISYLKKKGGNKRVKTVLNLCTMKR